jgi:hypothetical protein
MTQTANRASSQGSDQATTEAPDRGPGASAARTRESQSSPVDPTLEPHLRRLQAANLHESFDRQDAFLYLEEFLPPELTERLIAAVHAVTPAVNRNYLPGHKQGGSVSRHAIDKMAPFIAELYRSEALIRWLETLSGDKLQVSPADDPHAYALYFYTKPGDHLCWHYDTSYYEGRRYTMLLGVIDNSSCRLDYELHTRTPEIPAEAGSVRIPPGGLVFFDGDKLRHRITPARANEFRVSLTFEYVTNPHMRPWQRFISNMKDSIAYFGFGQVFRRKGEKHGAS